MKKLMMHCLLGVALSAIIGAACSGGTEQVGLIKGLASSGGPGDTPQGGSAPSDGGNTALQIGRASCRERVCVPV